MRSTAAKLGEWLAWACRSKLEPLVRLVRTICAYCEGLLAYVQTRLNNGPVEGLNGDTRVITHRAFGFHDAGALNRHALLVLRKWLRGVDARLSV